MGNYIECDTDLVTKATKEIDDLMTEYEKDINSFYDLMDFTKPDKKAWTGNNAHLYTNVVMLDKPDLLSFGEAIKDITKQVNQFISDLESTVKENEESCENDQEEYVYSYRTGRW